MTRVRDFEDADAEAVAAIAAQCDETGPVSGGDAGYLRHVAARGRVVVADGETGVLGYGGAIRRDGTSFLTDLFVAPPARDHGVGGLLLAALWDGSRDRATSASQDPRALASYARYGAVPRWPLLYLAVPGTSAEAPPPLELGEHMPGEAGWHLRVEGLATARVRDPEGGPAVTAAVRRDGDSWVVARALTPDPSALVRLVAGLRPRVGPSGAVRLCVPGPHPALPDLLRAGARVSDVDLWCATAGASDLVDPTRELPSPGLS
ncbi:MAG: hypothetical protein GC157_02770 [Frankiales bacterium]|nr:hypothetical protein [Frankiales bacterium]